MGARRIAGGVVAAALLAVPVHAPASPRPPTPSIWVMNSDGTDRRPLVDLVWDEAPLAWSPDGARLLYLGDEGMTVLDLASGTSTAIGRGHWAVWSPSGNEIAYVAGAGYEQPGSLYVSAPDGSAPRLLANRVADRPVAWSPDGSRLAFVSCQGEAGCDYGVWLIGADGTGMRRLSEDGTSASWSPDGTALAVDRRYGGIDVVHVATGVSRAITSQGFGPQWGPRGQIAYWYRADDGPLGVWLVDPDGSNPTRVHEGMRPQWSPDGSRLVFYDDRDLWLHAPGTEGASMLAPGGEREFLPAWSPDGRSIAYLSEEVPTEWPDYARSVSVAADEGRLRARVEVVDDYRPCNYRVRVVLQRRTKGEWTPQGKARTDKQGRVRWALDGLKWGTYRVMAPQRWSGYPGDSSVCQKADSMPVRLRG